ncbi:hypothetical protein TSUD_35680 [Trifolium subterraneum]|uniref:Uncharacterized protein n=1 Tax=Trifolium subterraneum TaxID=3900 RepID=A0A2Z6LZY0_TRISU|nr:hypothetical protein TSUD_35680 [Trifolium subterraneum]
MAAGLLKSYDVRSMFIAPLIAAAIDMKAQSEARPVVPPTKVGMPTSVVPPNASTNNKRESRIYQRIEPVVFCVAALFGKVRLIDNMEINL